MAEIQALFEDPEPFIHEIKKVGNGLQQMMSALQGKDTNAQR